MGTEPVAYCRDIEQYLCQKNDGHLIRIVGPSFDLVSAWASQGVPLKVACRGIDRYFERYYAKGPRRRPVRIDFCEADVLDVFDEWRRALGLPAGRPSDDHPNSAAGEAAGEADERGGAGRPRSSGPSLPMHLQRVLLKLTSARAGGTLDASFDRVLDEVARELDLARGETHGLRGDARAGLISRLATLDRQVLDAARAALSETDASGLTREAEMELAAFRLGMTADAFARAQRSAVDRLIRERFHLPIIAFG